MQLSLVALAMVFFSTMSDSYVGKSSKTRKQRWVSSEGTLSCPKGCERCSEDNGCTKCKAKLFIYLERNDIRQVGVCLASCPMGYFGMRNPEGNNRCTQCKIDNCDACFYRNFCTKCKEGLYSHSGRCYVSCPPGKHTANDTMECIECQLSEWTQWSPCVKRNKTCGFKKGSQSRVRLPLRHPRSRGTPLATGPSQCAPQTERRKCVVDKTPCLREKKSKRGQLENSKGVKDSDRGGGGRRRKGQSRTTVVPNVTSSSVTA
ncbi:R-spondin-1 [Corythoichthys intestinalis]|uniref:R-spondin-1 n=1 Tax=Corythoichthys intestinalis TaxID=161448 RepID=UPI0025A4F207|nr:R-spondin-1 [Corythoichthys intestinalis]XP_057689579.1 R-spondin-1 [Corythoichthys intestinalis]XP_061789167.1 R-spondin-1-like [Nerophis lumbriciformis]